MLNKWLLILVESLVPDNSGNLEQNNCLFRPCLLGCKAFLILFRLTPSSKLIPFVGDLNQFKNIKFKEFLLFLSTFIIKIIACDSFTKVLYDDISSKYQILWKISVNCQVKQLDGTAKSRPPKSAKMNALQTDQLKSMSQNRRLFVSFRAEYTENGYTAP